MKASQREAVVGPQGPGMGLSEDEQRVYGLVVGERSLRSTKDYDKFSVLCAGIVLQLTYAGYGRCSLRRGSCWDVSAFSALDNA